ncbi:MAG: hypothetical protein U1F25_17575 [Rubrivivax sp.]
MLGHLLAQHREQFLASRDEPDVGDIALVTVAPVRDADWRHFDRRPAGRAAAC